MADVVPNVYATRSIAAIRRSLHTFFCYLTAQGRTHAARGCTLAAAATQAGYGPLALAGRKKPALSKLSRLPLYYNQNYSLTRVNFAL
jgi:hypothetical protein